MVDSLSGNYTGNPGEPDLRSYRVGALWKVAPAIDLRAAVEDLPDPLLRELVDVILLELGKRVVVLD